jgi:hypothetical protein
MQKLWQQLSVPAGNPSRRWFRFALALAFMLAWLVPVVLPAASFTASLDRNTITLGESVTLSLAFEGGVPQSAPTPPAIANLNVADVGWSQSMSADLVSGRSTTTLTHNFSLTPAQPGDFVIPSLTSEVGSQKLTTQPLKLKVLKPGAATSDAADSGSQLAFFKLVLPKKEIYLGETIIAELQLYVSDKVQNFGSFQLAAMPAQGFTVGTMKERQHGSVQTGNGIYTEIPIAIVLTPVKTGALSIGPITAGLVLELPSTNRRRDSFWDPFGVLGRNERRRVSLVTEPETVQAIPLPAQDAPPNFNGAVGNYTLAVTAGPTNVALGDPITVRIQISGSGALDSIALPDQPAWHDFKLYPPTSKVESSDPLGVTGTKTFEEIVVPQNSDVRALPPVSFSFFDSDSKVYRTLTGPAIALSVRPGGSTAVPVIAAANRAAQDNPPPSSDIVSIKQRLGEVATLTPPLIQRPWFLGLQSVPALALLSAVLWRKRTENLANNPRLRRRRQTLQIIREGRNDLRRFAAGNNSDAFFATLFRLLQEQLGERLDLQASAITEAVIEERLRPSGVPEPALASLHELFQTCNLARYAPIKTSQELAAFIPKIETVLSQLQELKL